MCSARELTMRSPSIAIVLAVLAFAVSPGACGAAAQDEKPVGPVIDTSDVNRFYEVYDEAGGRPTADALQQEYIDPGSDGLHVLARMRKVTGQSIAEAIARRPGVYAEARRCIDVLPRVRERLVVALRKLLDQYPEARLPPITIAVGRGKPVGIGGRDTGVQISLEALCATDWIEPELDDRFVRVIMHEYIHVQQAVPFSELAGATVLSASLEEGAAEFITEFDRRRLLFVPGCAGRRA